MIRGSVRGVVVALVVAACGRTPVKPAQHGGDNQATAIAIDVTPGKTTGTYEGQLGAKLEQNKPPRWHAIDLPAGVGNLEIHLVYFGAVDSVSFEVLDAKGVSLGTAEPEVTNAAAKDRLRGGRDLSRDNVSGRVFVRVFVSDEAKAGDAYELHVWFTPKPLTADAAVDCDPSNIDRNNPRCAGVQPCDPNQPDFKNPSCCALHCFTDRPCSSSFTVDPSGGIGWIPFGARKGINLGYKGRFSAPGIDGSEVTGTFSILKVDADRSRIAIQSVTAVDPSKTERGLAKLYPPEACVTR